EGAGGLEKIRLVTRLQASRFFQIVQSPIYPVRVLDLDHGEVVPVFRAVWNETDRLTEHLNGRVEILLFDELLRPLEVLGGELFGGGGGGAGPGGGAGDGPLGERPVVSGPPIGIREHLVCRLHALEDRGQLLLETRQILAMPQVRVEEPASLEVSLPDLFR